MPSVSTITGKLTLILGLLSCFAATAQENSPYSRYGIGDLYPSQNINNRGMGGLSVATTNSGTLGQSINFTNPASYAEFQRFPGIGARVLYDFALSIDSRDLSSKLPIQKYSSANFIPAYVVLGFPIAKNLGGVLGVRPYSRISYSIIDRTRLAGIDSAQYLYEGSGGLNQAFFGLGKRWGNLSLGFNAGYMFGKKETSTKLNIINTDSNFYYYNKSNSTTTTSLNKFFVTFSGMYDIPLKTFTKNKVKQEIGLRLGGSVSLKQTFKGSQDIYRETFEYDASGGTSTLDSVYKVTGTRVNVSIPAVYTFGAMFHKSNRVGIQGESKERLYEVWAAGFELETAKWSQYRFGGLPDKLSDYWQLRVGGHFLPSSTSQTLLGRSTYRLGVAFGKDYINADNNGLKTFSGTFGIGLPIAVRNAFSSQFTLLNLAMEVGKRGTGVNNVTENYFRVSAGLSLSDIWFRKRKYD